MWMIGDNMGEFEVELLSQKFVGACNYFPLNWKLRMMYSKQAIQIFGYFQNDFGVHILTGTKNNTSPIFKITQTLLGYPNDPNSTIIFDGNCTVETPPNPMGG
jgi:hypothetical protein